MNPKFFEQITKKKEFSQLPRIDIEKAFSHFEKRQCSDEEKIRLTRGLLHRVFGSFASEKLLSPKNKSPDWILRKHLSTRERLSHYREIYERIFKNVKGEASVIDLGAGINGFSCNFFGNKKINYLAVESMGQLVDLTNNYFKAEKIKGKAVHLSLFEFEKIKKIILEQKTPRMAFLFKVVDSLEMLERNYSKKLILEIAPLCDFLVLSFATRSMVRRKKFFAKRAWILDFLRENFEIADEFEFGGEKYVVFHPR